MPKDNDNIEVPWTGDAPWDSTDSNTRLPTPEEIASGFPCGPADQALFNFTVTYAWGQIYNAMLEAGVTPDLTDLTQLSDIMLIAQNNLSDIDDAPTARSNLGLGNVDDTSDLDKPVSNDTQDALNLKANINSPVLTGIPEAPTAAAGTNTTQIATTAFVRAAAAKNTVVLTTSGNFTVPAGVTSIQIYAWGGGGGGCGSETGPTKPSGGGGGAGFSLSTVSVTPGQVIPYVIGSGGTGSAVGAVTAGDGGNTTILTIAANGGKGGVAAGFGAAAGGTATGGSLLNITGANGGGGNASASHTGGNGGAPAFGGQGGLSTAFGGGVGVRPGGGGGGGGHGGGAGAVGGNGAAGMIMITY